MSNTVTIGQLKFDLLMCSHWNEESYDSSNNERDTFNSKLPKIEFGVNKKFTQVSFPDFYDEIKFRI